MFEDERGAVIVKEQFGVVVGDGLRRGAVGNAIKVVKGLASPLLKKAIKFYAVLRTTAPI